VSSEALSALREAGRIAAAARDAGARLIIAGARVRDVCAFVEDEIRRRGGQAAFPVQSSRNEVAAHYCPGPDDGASYADGDLAKLDVGVHVDGYVVDTATTVNVGGGWENGALVGAARAALEAAIAAAGPGVLIREVSAAIYRALRSRGAQPMRTLCGHHLARWVVHCPPPIPNVPEDSEERLEAGAVVAIEPFATRGEGLVAEEGRPEVFRLLGEGPEANGIDPDLLGALRERRGLPFSRRDLARFPPARVEAALDQLVGMGALATYAPLVETARCPVAQAEHTLVVGPEGVEVLTL
jgi:methionyl aminopeptidase